LIKRNVAAAVGAVLLVGGTAVFAGAASAAASASRSATATGWQVTQLLGASSDDMVVQAITVESGKDAWISGYAPFSPNGDFNSLLIEHWTGSALKQIAVPAAFDQNVNDQTISASSATNMWTFPETSKGSYYALHWNGKAWSKFSVGKVFVLSAVAVGARSDWAFGDKIPTTPVLGYGKPYAAYYNGSSWKTSSIPGVATHVSGVSASDIWASGPNAATAGDSGRAVKYIAMHWNGYRWNSVSIPQPAPLAGDFWTPRGIAAIGPENIWVLDTPAGSLNGEPGPTGTALLHWNGKKWTTVTNTSYTFESFALDGSGGLWLPGVDANSDVTIAHYSGGKWSYQSPPTESGYTDSGINFAWIPGTKSLWGIAVLTPVSSGSDEDAIVKYVP
jgi:hypothetical protein